MISRNKNFFATGHELNRISDGTSNSIPSPRMLRDRRTWRDWWRPMQDRANLVAASVIRDAVRGRPGGGIARRRSRTRTTCWRRRSPANQDEAAAALAGEAGQGKPSGVWRRRSPAMQDGADLRAESLSGHAGQGRPGGSSGRPRCRTVAVSLDAAAISGSWRSCPRPGRL